MDDTHLLLRFGLALIVGLLIGIQRELAAEDPKKDLAAGVRTFPLLSIFGYSLALLSEQFHSIWPLCVGLLGIAALLAVNYYIEASAGHIGLTTKAAALIAVVIGALCFWSELVLVAALGVAVTLLLSIKLQLHRFAHTISREDIFAVLKLAVISAIILPVLPDRAFGPAPFTIFNPFKIWLFVVFISSISFIGYILIKVAGSKRGIGLTGLLGGIASSTAVTFSFTRRSQQVPELSNSFALAITVAWTVMYVRVLVAVAALNLGLIRMLWLPMLIPVVFGLIYCGYLLRRERIDGGKHAVTMANPFELGFAIKFGLLFAFILFISKASQVYFGSAGIYLSGFLSGLADVDAIALSMAKLSSEANGIAADIAVRAIIIATVSNTALKGAVAMIGGAPAMKKAIAPGCAVMILAGAATLLLV